MSDNLETPVVDNPETPEVETPEVETPVTETPVTPAFSWKSKLGSDMSNSPTLQKFEDTPEGLKKEVESHLSLEKLLGHDKVPIPKNADDVEGWNRFNKAMGIPEKAEAYGLEDVTLPGNMQDMAFDKQKFAETVHQHRLTPAQAKGLWKAYTGQSIEAYGKFLTEHKANLDKVVNELRAEWGDAYDVNVDLGQTVINKFAGDKESEDFLTATMLKDPRAVRFLAKIGNQFAENKVGEFQIKRFAVAPDEARNEIERITKDMNGPYWNQGGKFTEQEHQEARKQVDLLYTVVNKSKKG